METSSLIGSGSLANYSDKHIFGAEVVSKTLDYMNGTIQNANSLVATDKQTFGAGVVSKTLDYMNSGGGASSGSNSMSQTFNFSQSVLGAYTNGIGALANAYA